MISFMFLMFLQQNSIKYALNNINNIENLKLNSNNKPRNIGNNVYVVFYAGLGYLNTDYFEGYFNDDEVYKLVNKINNDGKIIDNGVSNVTKLTTEDIQIVKEKILHYIIKK